MDYLIPSGTTTLPFELVFYHIFGPKVYFGVADQWADLFASPQQWSYTRRAVDGFYVNFIMMNWMKNDPTHHPDVNATAPLFSNKNAYLESDIRPHPDGASEADDQWYISALQQAGFKVVYTSLNYGWSKERAENLATYSLVGQARRLNLVQQGPWDIGGDINSNHTNSIGITNAQNRAFIQEADGCSTDGPMGYWVCRSDMRSGSISMVRYARSQSKLSMVMLAPYEADCSTYDPSKYLETSKSCIQAHEDADAVPDIWVVFEYATSIAAVPECDANGNPFNSTSGVAYYLCKHLNQ